MKILNNWILKKAKAIQAKEAAELAKSEAARKEKYESNRLLNQKRRDTIMFELQKQMEHLESKECHIKVGDNAVINYYSIGRNGRNGWDGGPTSLLTHIPQEERTAPVTVKITKLYVDTSLAHGLIDKFFENHSDDWMNVHCPPEKAWYVYCQWLKTRRVHTDLGDRFGLYKTAHFDYAGSFKPKWGLNLDSFLREGTPEYTKTIELWTREIEINRKKEECREEMAQLEAEMKKIDEEYREIKFV